MELIESADFFERVRSYLDGQIPLSNVDEWIVERVPALAPPRRDAVSELASRIQLWIAELSQGHREEAEVRTLIDDYLRQRKTLVFFAVSSYADSASSTVFSLSVPIPQQAPARASLSLRR